MLETINSTIALVLAIFTLGWNIFRDVVNRNRVRVTGLIGPLVGPGDKTIGQYYIVITAVNCGPASNTLSGLSLQKSKFGKKPENAFVLEDWKNPRSARFPHTFGVGDQAQYIFSFNQDCFLKMKPTKIGIWDVFGKTHWMKRRLVKRMVGTWQREFQK